MNKIMMIAIIAFVSANANIAANAAPDAGSAIDKRCQDCIDKNPSTAGNVDCLDKAYKEWDAELNKRYKALNAKLSPKAKAALQTSELQWIKYRDAERQFINQMYTDMEGTMYIPMSVSDNVDLVKGRAIQLKQYSDIHDSAN
jgi:uncharacterized protein YecT (DUF1311 family)